MPLSLRWPLRFISNTGTSFVPEPPLHGSVLENPRGYAAALRLVFEGTAAKPQEHQEWLSEKHGFSANRRAEPGEFRKQDMSQVPGIRDTGYVST